MLDGQHDTLPMGRRWTRDDFESERDHEPLIHPRALEPLTHYAEQFGDPSALLEGTNFEWRDFEARALFSWAEFLIITQNFMLRFGREDRVLFEATRAVIHLPGYTMRSMFAGLVAGPHSLYRASAKWFAPWTFPCIYPNGLQALPNGQYDIDIKLRPGFTPCSHFFVLNRAMMTTATCMVGLDDALVDMAISGGQAMYRITPPVSGTILARVRRSWDTFWRGGATMASHLEWQYDALRRANTTLQAKVHELERTERELRRARAQYMRAISGTQEGVFEISLKDDSLIVSPRWLEVVGLPSSTADVSQDQNAMLPFERWRALVHEEDRDLFDATFASHIEGKTDSWECVFRLHEAHQEGVRWVRVRARVSGQDRSLRYLSGSIADVTREERTKRDMPRLIEESVYPLCVVSNDGELLLVNRSFRRLFETSGEVNFPTVERIDAFMTATEWDDLWETTWAQPDGVLLERQWAMPGAPGESKDVRLKVQALTLLSGDCVLIHVEDLAQARAEQARQIHMDRIMSMGTMAASIGHEINNPMAYLQSNLELAISLLPMLNSTDAPTPHPTHSRVELYDDLRMSLDEALEGTQRVVKIVRNLRSFTRHPTRRQANAAPALHTLDALVSPAISMVRAALSQYAKLEITSTLDWEHTLVRLDASSIVQVLTNLLINAAHAVEEASTLDPSSPLERARHVVTLDVRHPPGRPETLEFVVSDTGIGIDATDKERIFTPFFTSKRQGKGTGLGLYICKMLVEELGGTLSVESELGQGARFTVRFAACLSYQETSAPDGGRRDVEEAEEARVGEGSVLTDQVKALAIKPRLLLIDDEVSLLQSFARTLSTHYDVITCVDGAHAMRALDGGYEPHVILCDVIMPAMNGVELFDELERAHPALCERVVFMSGGSSLELRKQISERGVDLLEKPLKKPALLEAMRKMHEE